MDQKPGGERSQFKRSMKTALLEVSSRYETLKQQTEGKQIAPIDKLEQELMVIRENCAWQRGKYDAAYKK